MDTFSDLVTAVQSDMTVSTDSTLFDPTQIKSAINRAYAKAVGMHPWPGTEDSLKTSAIASHEYYDYPQSWFPQSIWKLRVDGNDFEDPLVFKDYQYEKENSLPSGLKRIWANQGNRFFIYPIPTTTGNNNIEIWGQKAPALLSADIDTTIFSYSMREGNMAILLEAVRILKIKGEDIQQTIIPRVGEMRDLEAKEILTRLWTRIVTAQGKYEKTQPMFDVPDMFGRHNNLNSIKNKIGDF